jgi:uncharacterized lipoprotein YehR (DUF1307 family)
MNILKSLLVASVMLPTMTSCLGSGEESQTYKFTYSNNYTYVTDVDTGESKRLRGNRLTGAVF